MKTIEAIRPPCFVDGLSIEAYHAGEGVSSSILKRYLEKPPAYVQKDRPVIATDAMNTGDLCHATLFEPHRAVTSFACEPETFDGEPIPSDGRKRKKPQKLFLAKWRESLPDVCKVVTRDDKAHAKCIAEAVRRSPFWMALTGDSCAGGEVAERAVERSYFWIDKETGLLCKGRTDFEASDIIVDLKITKDSRARQFAKQVDDLYYHVSAAMYCEGYEAVHGRPPRAFIWIAVERDLGIPEIYRATPAHLALGLQEYRQALDIYAKCRAEGRYPSQTDGMIQDLPLSYWAAKRLQSENL